MIILALKSASNVTFVKDNEKCSALARKIQERLGFKFKLAQCQHSQHLWTAKFFFDRNELEGNYFIMVSYDTEDELFACTLNFENIVKTDKIISIVSNKISPFDFSV